MEKPGPSLPKMTRLEKYQNKESSSDEEVEQDLEEKVLNEAILELNNIKTKLESATKILQVELLKYGKLRQPTYDKRAKPINKAMPILWPDAFQNHPILGRLLKHHNNEEAECFGLLKNIEVEEFDDMENDGYRIKFLFGANPFFENKELVKEVRTGKGFGEVFKHLNKASV